MPTNTKEAGLEELIINFLVHDTGYEQGVNEDYNRDYAIDETRSERNEQAKKDFESRLRSFI